MHSFVPFWFKRSQVGALETKQDLRHEHCSLHCDNRTVF
ncbi:MAG: hypothetical protein QOE96_3680 [Blastocatellia bacterium]|nr:hypothetical protein [Blastocatellia bacterium]